MTDSALHLPTDGLELRSLLRADARLELSLQRVPLAPPEADEIVVRVEATPINPSDLGLLLGPADPASAVSEAGADGPVTTLAVPPAALKGLQARLDQSLRVGNEGAGTVVAAGPTPAAQALLGRTVTLYGGAMYAQYRRARADQCLPLPAGVSAAQGASAFVNPMTALCMLDVLRREGHTALVHTAAASNLGQMLNRLCLKDGVPLVSIVRSEAQRELLRAQGAVHVCNSTSADFASELQTALAATDATLAFDAIGGGELAGRLLAAMEANANRAGAAYQRYGSARHKQVYIYGALDLGPTLLKRNFGAAWGVAGWLLPNYLAKIGAEATAALQARVLAELTTTFASHYSATLTLAEALAPKQIARYARRATGEKFLINPNAG